jgi:hypothetical protein
MKRFIAAVSFAVLAVPVLAAEHGGPFEQTQLDRMLPSLGQDKLYVAEMAGDTRSDSSIASDAGSESVFASDHNFISPPQ